MGARLRWNLAESMAGVAVVGVGLMLPSEVAVPVAVIGAGWLAVACLPPGWVRAGMTVFAVLVLGALFEHVFPVGRLPLRSGRPAVVPMRTTTTASPLSP